MFRVALLGLMIFALVVLPVVGGCTKSTPEKKFEQPIRDDSQVKEKMTIEQTVTETETTTEMESVGMEQPADPELATPAGGEAPVTEGSTETLPTPTVTM